MTKVLQLRANDRRAPGPSRALPPLVCGRARTLSYAVAPLLILFILLVFPGCVSSLPLHAQRFEARLLDQDENFAGLDVNAIVQDRQGHLWVATQSGVLIYDGSRFHAYGREDGLSDPTAFSLLVDSSGTLWAGTHGGLFWFDGQRFRELLCEGESLHIGVNSMLASSKAGEVVARTSRELYSIQRTAAHGDWSVQTYWQRHPAYKSDKDWNGVGFDAKGNLVMGCDEALCVLEDGNVRTLGPTEGVARDYYVSIFLARDGTLWARGRKHIVTLRPADASAKEVGDLMPPGALATIHRRFTQDLAGSILTPTALGFATWDGTRWTETRSTSQGPISGASAVLCDREGSIWIGTDGTGLLQSRGYRVWANYGREEGFDSPNVTAIQKDRAGSVWFGTVQHTMLLRKGASALTPSPLTAKQDTVDVAGMAASPDGGMWVATQLGAIKHVAASGSLDVSTSIDSYIRRVRLDGDGVLWIAASGGLFTLRCSIGGACDPKPFAGEGWIQSSVRDLALVPDGSLWAARDNGLVHIRHGHATNVPVLGMDGVAIHGRIDQLAPDADGTLWIARASIDLLHLRLRGGRAESFERYGKPQLPSDVFSFIEPAPDGSLWIGTDRGIGRISHKTLELANRDDGLIWNTTGEYAFLADSDGTVWVGTALGVSHLLRPAEAFTRAIFPAEIRTIHYNDAILQNGDSLKWTGGVTTIDFAGLTFRGNQSLVYYYRLQGFDDSVILTHSPFVRFQRLPAGRYVFSVTAQDPVHNVFSAPAEVAFTLLPPWWLTWWFKGLMAVFALLLLVAVWHVSHLALLAQRRRLQRLVTERTRELESMALRDGLTGLLNRNAILERLSNEIARVQTARRPSGQPGERSVCVSLIDLDHFKRVNDTYGHLAGDTVLREAASRLQNAVRATDYIGRYGGEEFIVIFTDIGQGAGLLPGLRPGIDRCELMRQALSALPVVHEGTQLTVTCSIGLSNWLGEGDTLAGLIARADSAMYAAKSSGRNRVEFAA